MRFIGLQSAFFLPRSEPCVSGCEEYWGIEQAKSIENCRFGN